MRLRKTKGRVASRDDLPAFGPRFKGRHWVALWLAAFLVVALLVIWRQSAALRTAQQVQALQKTRGALEVSRSSALEEVHRARSRTVLVPLAVQRLGLRLPQDSEITILQDPRPR